MDTYSPDDRATAKQPTGRRLRWVVGAFALALMTSAAAGWILLRAHAARLRLERVGGATNPCGCSQRIEP